LLIPDSPSHFAYYSQPTVLIYNTISNYQMSIIYQETSQSFQKEIKLNNHVTTEK